MVKAVPLHAKQALRGGRGTALPILDLSARRRRVVNATPQLLYAHERDPVPILLEAGRAFGPVWTGMANLPPPPIRVLNRGPSSLWRVTLRTPLSQPRFATSMCVPKQSVKQRVTKLVTSLAVESCWSTQYDEQFSALLMQFTSKELKKNDLQLGLGFSLPVYKTSRPLNYLCPVF
jgi:hypothetical protein